MARLPWQPTHTLAATLIVCACPFWPLLRPSQALPLPWVASESLRMTIQHPYYSKQTHTHTFLYFLNSRHLKIDFHPTSATHSQGHPGSRHYAKLLYLRQLRPKYSILWPHNLAYSLTFPTATELVPWWQQHLQSVHPSFPESVCSLLTIIPPYWASHGQFQWLSHIWLLDPWPQLPHTYPNLNQVHHQFPHWSLMMCIFHLV